MMERRAKERLIGASILVALLVLIVPELLSGPKPAVPVAEPPRLPAAASTPEPNRTVTVDLATSKAPVQNETEADSTPPPSAAPAPAPAAASAPPPPPAAAAYPRGASVESPAPPPISKGGAGRGEAAHASGWSVQLGSFASRANADNLVRQLTGQGFAAYVVSGGSGAATRHRVRVGPFADRDAGARAAAKLKTLGHASSLMAPGT